MGGFSKDALQGLSPQQFADAIATPAMLSPREAAPLMRGGGSLRTGEFSVLVGPVLHAGPACATRRRVLFFTFNTRGGARYNSDSQYGPTNSALWLNSAELVVHRFRDWASSDPTQYWANLWAEDQRTTKTRRAYNAGERTLWELAQEWQKRRYADLGDEDVKKARRNTERATDRA